MFTDLLKIGKNMVNASSVNQSKMDEIFVLDSLYHVAHV